MGKVFPEIDEKLKEWIERQKVFFVATAPDSREAHLNLSPKGLDSFRILGPQTVAYADLPGSGIETASHVQQNGRIVLMFCEFEKGPRIVRIHGRGSVVAPENERFKTLVGEFPEFEWIRCFIVVECTRISDSCGYGVPRYQFVSERKQLTDWCSSKGTDELIIYQKEKNSVSIDGIPGLPPSS